MPLSPLNSALFTDLYELTMAEGYLRAEKNQNEGVFELTFRRCPFNGEFAVVAGHDLIKEYLENFKFHPSDIEYLKSLPTFSKAPRSFFESLQKMDLLDIEVLGIPEGELVFARVPLLQLRGPLYKVQILESALLNAINFSTLVATYARRIRLIAGKRKLVEFGMRRAQGPDGAMTASRASYLGGFDASSNVLAGKKYGIPLSGTMAHSYVQSFWRVLEKDLVWDGENISTLLKTYSLEDGLQTNEGELGAFLSYAKTFPEGCLLLVDTYDTLRSGVPNALRIFKLLRHFKVEPLGIRLDSGDLVYQSKEARKMMDREGFKAAKIFASNELSESVIASLQDQGAQIDAYGVGTHLTTSYAQPALGGVYKLVEVDGRPRMKISQQTEKLIIPETKRVYRLYSKNDEILMDYMTSKVEETPKPYQELVAIHPSDPFKRAVVKPAKVKSLLQPLFRNGRWLDGRTLDERRKESLEAMKELRPDISRRKNPTPYKVSISVTLKRTMDELYEKEAPENRLA